MTFVVKRTDPTEALLNNVPEGEHSATLISIGDPTHYGPGHKLKLPLRFQIDGYPGGVVLRRIRLVDRNGKPYEEFGPNSDMVKFLDMAGVEQPHDAIGMRFVVKISRNGAFSDVSDVLHTCTPHVYSPRISLLVNPNSKIENRESIPEAPTENDTKQGEQKPLSPLSTNSGTDKTPLPAKESRPINGQGSPAVASLAAKLTYASDGLIAFQDKQRARLAEVLKEFEAAEIKQVFSAWLEDQDLSDPKNLSFLPDKFVQTADSLCYTNRRKKREAEENRAKKDAHSRRLQAQAEQERRAAEARQREEDELFDPIGMFSDGPELYASA